MSIESYLKRVISLICFKISESAQSQETCSLQNIIICILIISACTEIVQSSIHRRSSVTLKDLTLGDNSIQLRANFVLIHRRTNFHSAVQRAEKINHDPLN